MVMRLRTPEQFRSSTKLGAAAARLDEDAEALQFAAPDRELPCARHRRIDLVNLGTGQGTPKKSPKTHHENASGGRQWRILAQHRHIFDR